MLDIDRQAKSRLEDQETSNGACFYSCRIETSKKIILLYTFFWGGVLGADGSEGEGLAKQCKNVHAQHISNLEPSIFMNER